MIDNSIFPISHWGTREYNLNTIKACLKKSPQTTLYNSFKGQRQVLYRDFLYIVYDMAFYRFASVPVFFYNLSNTFYVRGLSTLQLRM